MNVSSNGANLSITSSAAVKAQSFLEEIDELDPQYQIEGVRNVWIIKPGAKSRGRGIDSLDTFIALHVLSSLLHATFIILIKN